jgi:hypothetical protein
MALRRSVALGALLITACFMSLVAVAPATAARPTDRIPLPDGFQPEGIYVAPDGTFYAGSILDGTILQGDVKTGRSHVLVTPPAGRLSAGMEVHRGLLYVAGGPTGVFVYDAATGATVRAFEVGAGAFVNDVVVAKDAAWFTNSFEPVLYRLPLSPDGTPGDELETIPLTGDFTLQDGFNLNGIETTPNGHRLISVQSNTGDLFRIDPSTGETTRINLGGDALVAGDGLLFQGHTLYVGRNTNVVDLVRLDASFGSGHVVDEITSPDFAVATTLGRKGHDLYVIQARFDIVPTPDTPYWIAVVPLH